MAITGLDEKLMQARTSGDQSVRCRACGGVQGLPTGTFCSRCGAPVAATDPRSSSSPDGGGWDAPLPSPRRRSRVVVGAVAALLLIAGLVVRGVDRFDRAGGPDEAGPTHERSDDDSREPDEAAPPVGVVVEAPTIGRWRGLQSHEPEARAHHGAIWTGQCRGVAVPRRQPCGEVIVWGGWSAGEFRDDIAAYDPLRDRWRRVTTSAPVPRGDEGSPDGVWTGSELVLWGRSGPATPAGIAVDVLEGGWRALPEAPLSPRTAPAVAWTGTELFVWGGRRPGDGETLSDGAILDLEAGTWRPVEAAPITPRAHATAAVWRNRVVVWGGADASGAALLDGALYEPGQDRWAPLPALDPPVSVVDDIPPAVTVASDTLVAIGSLERQDGVPVAAALRLDTGRWRLIDSPAGIWRDPRVAIARSSFMSVVVVRGSDVATPGTAPGGAVLYPDTDGWRQVAPWMRSLEGQSMTWTGTELILWGGKDGSDEVGEGAAYRLRRTRAD